MTKSLGFKAWALVAGLGLSVVTVMGCNPEEPAPKPAAPSTPPAVVKPGPKAEEKKPVPPAAAPAPVKDSEKK